MVTTSPTESTNLPAPATALAVVLVLGALLDFAHIAAYLSGADVPAAILALKIGLGVAALAAVAGLWSQQRWAVPLALGVAVVNLLVGAWGFVESLAMAGSAAERVVTGLGVLISLAVIALAVRKPTRRVAA